MFAFSAERFLSSPLCTDVRGSFCDPFISREELRMFSLIFFVVSKWTYGTNPVFEKPVQFSGWRILSSGKSGTGYGKSRTYLMPQHFPEKNFRIVSFLEVSSLDVSPHILFCRLQVDVRNQPCFRLLVRFSGWRI